jgi:hypothetical protein
MTSVTIPDTVTNLGRSAFAGCWYLSNVTMSTNVITMGDYVFAECYKLSSITLPNSLTSLGIYAFAWCGSLTNVTLGQSLTVIPDHAFESCSNVIAISIPATVTNIGNEAFFMCRSLRDLPLGSCVRSIGTQAFGACDGLTSLQIPESVASIGDYAFNPCINLTNLTLPHSLTNIGNLAFHGCIKLPNLVLPSGLLRIGDSAFNFCTNLTTVSIPATLTNIGSTAFQFCRNLSAFTVDPGNPSYSSLGGVLFDKEQTSLIQFPLAKSGSYTIPGTVTNIGIEAFGASVLNKIVFPPSLLSIGESAFAYCYGVTAYFFRGNAPVLAAAVFTSDPAVVYYLPSTTGWGPTFGGLPAQAWLPQIQTDTSTFGIQTNQFGFDVDWADGKALIIESCTNLMAPIWVPVTTNAINGGSLLFFDSGWTNNPNKFYRVRSAD